MPFYSFKCPECEFEFDKLYKMSNSDSIPECPNCNHDETVKIVTGCNFNLPGDDWASKNGRIKKQMTEKNKNLTQKQKERWDGKVKLVPNVDGERVDNWSEAKKLAASKKKDTTLYDKYIKKEKSK